MELLKEEDVALKTLIIAEAGVNHNGRMDLARKLIDAAAEAGADYVKFQTFRSKSLASACADKAEYQKDAKHPGETMLDLVKKLELPFECFLDLKQYCAEKGIGFLSAPFDIESAEYLYSIGVDRMKIPSGEITNLPLLEVIAQHSCPIVLSTGMSETAEIRAAIDILNSKGCKDITVLHCNTQYPTPMQDVNLLAMISLRETFEMPAGFSDHTLGMEIPIAAAALGAAVIEKHLTLDRNMEGPDHKASMEPDEFRIMISCIRNVEKALGNGRKQVTDSERENRRIARKSIVAARQIRKGERFSAENLTVKRPADGISPMLWYEVIGQIASRDFEEDELIAVTGKRD
ncbi:N-acetylneuraminate synthase [Anoxybacterium hadale]|uniref:N-acetylneuraminate synthase n=1 Tax=Anoxybacterium hadale TaxID=3408580 RepID=A0ACD1AAN8_9FIRM|nr:N-acetylneuraminate synthase [Clostridiales bacterium]